MKLFRRKLDDGQFHSFVAHWKGGKQRLYIDGKRVRWWHRKLWL